MRCECKEGGIFCETCDASLEKIEIDYKRIFCESLKTSSRILLEFTFSQEEVQMLLNHNLHNRRQLSNSCVYSLLLSRKRRRHLPKTGHGQQC